MLKNCYHGVNNSFLKTKGNEKKRRRNVIKTKSSHLQCYINWTKYDVKSFKTKGNGMEVK